MASSRARLLDVAKVYLQSRAERVLLPPPTRNPEAEPLLLKRKLQLEENNASRPQRLKGEIQWIGRLIAERARSRSWKLETENWRMKSEFRVPFSSFHFLFSSFRFRSPRFPLPPQFIESSLHLLKLGGLVLLAGLRRNHDGRRDKYRRLRKGIRELRQVPGAAEDIGSTQGDMKTENGGAARLGKHHRAAFGNPSRPAWSVDGESRISSLL